MLRYTRIYCRKKYREKITFIQLAGGIYVSCHPVYSEFSQYRPVVIDNFHVMCVICRNRFDVYEKR